MKYLGLFITGTDTGVGKTWIGSNLVTKLNNQGIKVLPQKPIESGCVEEDGKRFAEDANKYFLANKGSTAENIITPFRFKQVCSPAYASQLSKTELKLNTVIKHIEKNHKTDEFLIVEGAGGVYSPFTTDALNIDLIKQLKLPTILVAKDILGGINHILLSLNAMKLANINCLAVVLNEVGETGSCDTNNFNELKQYTNLPIIKNSFETDIAIDNIIQLL